MVTSPGNLCFKSEREGTTSMEDHREFISGVVEGAFKSFLAFEASIFVSKKTCKFTLVFNTAFKTILLFPGFYGRPWTFDQRKQLFLR